MGRRFYAVSISATLLALIAGVGWMTNPDVFCRATFRPPFFVTFLGVSTLLIEDGQDAILIDGYFTRPPGFSNPDEDKISDVLDAAGIKHTVNGVPHSGPDHPLKLAAVIVNHSHFDHAMDAPLVAKQTGALLVGSRSTANLGLAWNLPGTQLRTFDPAIENTYDFESFRVKAVLTGHSAINVAPGEITATSPPTSLSDYKEGGTYGIFIERCRRKMFVQGSAGYRQGALLNHHAEVAYLAVAGLGVDAGNVLFPTTPIADYWRETFDMVTPRRVYFIHWGTLSGPLSDNVLNQTSLELAEARAGTACGSDKDCKDFQRPRVGPENKVNPFQGL